MNAVKFLIALPYGPLKQEMSTPSAPLTVYPQKFLFLLAIMIAISRVYVGVHYPGDVIVGALVGYSISWIVITLWVILKMRELKRRQTWVWYESDPPVFRN